MSTRKMRASVKNAFVISNARSVEYGLDWHATRHTYRPENAKTIRAVVRSICKLAEWDRLDTLDAQTIDYILTHEHLDDKPLDKQKDSR